MQVVAGFDGEPVRQRHGRRPPDRHLAERYDRARPIPENSDALARQVLEPAHAGAHREAARHCPGEHDAEGEGREVRDRCDRAVAVMARHAAARDVERQLGGPRSPEWQPRGRRHSRREGGAHVEGGDDGVAGEG